jgi:beta-N-acetylhexosaminidase
VATPAFSSLESRDLLPYQSLLADQPLGVMVGHLNVPGLSDATPTSLAPAAYDLLRGRLGFQGLIVTDSLSSGAIAATIPPEQAAVRAIAAGADLALFVTIADPAAVISALQDAVGNGTLPEARVNDAVGRILAQKGLDPCTL